MSSNQLSLFQGGKTPSFPNSSRRRRRELPTLPERQISVSAFETLSACPYQQYMRGLGGYYGWDRSAPGQFQLLDAWKRVEGKSAWIGHLIHEWSTKVHFSQLDQALPAITARPPATIAELRHELFAHDFEQQWKWSIEMTMKRFLRWRKSRRDNRSKKMVWLWEHAMRDSLPPGAAADKLDLLALLKRCADRFESLGTETMGGAEPRDWLIVEGLLLKEGKIRQLPGRRLSQLQLREARAFPSYPLVVDGEKWKYNYTIDRLTYNRERNLYYLIDYKTGKSRERSGERKLTHQDQLKLYGSFVIQEHPEITPDRLVLRLIYVAEEGDDQNTIFDFQLDGMDEVRRWIAEAHEQVRIYRKFFRTVAEVLAAGGEREFLRILPRHLVLDAQGQFIARNFPVEALVALPERFPPTAARQGKVAKCAWCDRRSFCPEGTERVRVPY